MSGAGAKVFLDIMPRMGAGELDKVLNKVSGRVGKFSGDINKSMGQGIGTGASTAMEREAARMDAAMKSAQAGVQRSLEKVAKSQDAQVVNLTKYRAAQTNYAETIAKGYETSSSTALTALSRLESAEARYQASLRGTVTAAAEKEAALARMNEAQRDQAAFNDAQAASMGRVGKAVSTLTLGIGVGLAGAMFEGTKHAMDLDQQLTLLTTSAGESTKNLGTVREGVLKLQSQYGYSADDLTKALRTIEQAGYHGGDAIKVLTTSTKEAVLENADLKSVADLITTSMSDYGDKLGNLADVQGRANKAAELQVATIAQSKATLDEYSASLGSVEQIAKNANVSIDDLNASFAEMTQHGITPQQTTDYLKGNIRKLSSLTPSQLSELGAVGLDKETVQKSLSTDGLAATDEMISQAIMKKMGPDGRLLLDTYNQSKDQRKSADTMLQALKNDHPDEYAIASKFATDESLSNSPADDATAQDTWAKAVRGLPVADQGRLKQWQTTFQKSMGFSDMLRSGKGSSQSYIEAMNAAFGTQEASQTAQNLTGANYQELLDRRGAINANANDDVFNKEVAEQQDNLKAKLKDLTGSFRTLDTQLGETTQGPLKAFVEKLTSAAQWLTSHQGAMQGLIIGAGVAATALLTIKATNLVGGLFGRSTLGGDIIAGTARKGVSGVKKTASALGKGGAVAANYIGSYSEEVAAVAQGAREGVASGLASMKAGALSGLATAKDVATNPGFAADATRAKAKQVGNAAVDKAGSMIYVPGALSTKAADLSDRVGLTAAGMAASEKASKAGGKLRGFGSKLKGAGGRLGGIGMGIAAAGLPIAMIAGSGKANADDGSGGGDNGIDWQSYALDAAVAAPAVPAVYGAAKSVGKGVVSAAKKLPGAASKAVGFAGDVASVVGDFGSGAATKAASAIGTASKAVKEFQVGAKLAQAATKAWEVAQIALDAVMNANPIGLVVIAITALVAGVIYAYNHFQWFRDIVNDVWDWIKKFASWIGDEFMKTWHNALDDFKAIWSFLYDHIFKYYIDEVKDYLGAFIGYFKNVGKGIGDVLSGIKDLFSGNTQGIKKIWDGLKEIASAPVKFVIDTVYNDGIVKLWNGVAGVFHLDSMKLAPINFGASGGGIAPDGTGVVNAAGGTVLPGYTPGRDSIPAMLSPGEGVAVPELVQAIGPGNFMALNRKFSRGRPSANEKAGLPIPHADGGGIFGDIGHAIGKVGGAVGHGLSDAWDFAKDAAKIVSDPIGYIKKAFEAITKKAQDFGDSSEWAHALITFPDSVLNGVVDWVKAHIGLGGTGRPGDSPVAVGASAQQWRGLAMQALVDEGYTPPEAYIDAMIAQIQTESSGDPNIYQQVKDVNSGGNEAAGLLQVIPSTFEAYRDPRDPDNRLDPKANMDAALRYMRGRYDGDINGVWGHGHGYAGGGIAPGGVNDPKTGAEKDSGKLYLPTEPKAKKQKKQADETAINRAWSWIQSVAGTPYDYGTNLDCSGFLSGVYDSLLNHPIGRAFTTVSDFASLGFKKGLGGIFSIGVDPKADQAGHMAGTFNGHRIESAAGKGVVVDGPALGADASMFSDHWFLPGSMFVPAYTGKGANSLSAEGKLDNTSNAASKQAQKKRDSASHYSDLVNKEHDQAGKYQEKIDDYQKKLNAAQANLDKAKFPADKARFQKQVNTLQRELDNAKSSQQKANDRAEKYQQKADKANADAADLDSKAKTYSDRAQAGQFGEDDGTGTTKNGKSGDQQQQPHLMTPVEFGQQLGGLAVGGLLETFGLNNTVFADPNQSPIFRVANAAMQAKYVGPQNMLDAQAPKDDKTPSPSDYNTTTSDDSDTSDDDEVTTPETDPASDDPMGQAKVDIQGGNLPAGVFGDDNGLKIPDAATGQSLMDQLKSKATHDKGGWIKEGLQIVNNLTGQPEPVLNPQQLRWLQSAANGGGQGDGEMAKALVHVENQTIHNGDYGKAAKEIVREMNRYRKGR
ncbi:phage tail tape measure protein [Nocardia aobensis]|uniref:Phage tail tape measure protein n=1 Tax=Nocardia aobensis TaxID=257277 RepID=A0ABW6P5V7_9NOCA